MKHRRDFPRPALTVDIAIVRGSEADRQILLVRRGADPFEGCWALPGGFVEEGERLEDAARRELFEETGLDEAGSLVQLGAYGDPGRDPRGWTVSVVFLGHLEGRKPDLRAGDDAAETSWFDAWDLPEVAFDHAEIIDDAFRLARQLDRRRAGATGALGSPRRS